MARVDRAAQQPAIDRPASSGGVTVSTQSGPTGMTTIVVRSCGYSKKREEANLTAVTEILVSCICHIKPDTFSLFGSVQIRVIIVHDRHGDGVPARVRRFGWRGILLRGRRGKVRQPDRRSQTGHDDATSSRRNINFLCTIGHV